jgi:hypothetical protein
MKIFNKKKLVNVFTRKHVVSECTTKASNDMSPEVFKNGFIYYVADMGQVTNVSLGTVTCTIGKCIDDSKKTLHLLLFIN